MRLVKEQQISAFMPVRTAEASASPAEEYRSWRDAVLRERSIVPNTLQNTWFTQPVTITESRAAFWSEVIRRSKSAPDGSTDQKMTHDALASQLFISRRFLNMMAVNPDIKASDSLMQSAGLLFGVSFNYLSYSGAPLKTPQDIICDVRMRAWTLGIDPDSHDFTAYFGESFAQVRDSILAGDALNEPLSGRLNEYFHMRLLAPFTVREVHDDASLEAFLAELESRKTLWNMTQLEFCRWLGRTEDESWQVYKKNPILWQKWTKDLCRECGVEWFENGKAQARKIEAVPHYFDAALARTIRTELVRLRYLQPIDYCRHLTNKYGESISTDQLQNLLNSLKKNDRKIVLDKDQLAWTFRICEDLEIPLVRTERSENIAAITATLPDTYFRPSSGKWDASAREELGALMRKRRLGLGLSAESFQSHLRTSNITLANLEKGKFVAENLFQLVRALEVLHIVIDPFQGVPWRDLRIDCHHGRDVGNIIRHTYEKETVYSQRLADACCKLDYEARRYFLSTGVRHNHPSEIYEFALLARIILPPIPNDGTVDATLHFLEWQNEAGLDDLALAQKYKIGLLDLWKIRSGKKNPPRELQKDLARFEKKMNRQQVTWIQHRGLRPTARLSTTSGDLAPSLNPATRAVLAVPPKGHIVDPQKYSALSDSPFHDDPHAAWQLVRFRIGELGLKTSELAKILRIDESEIQNALESEPAHFRDLRLGALAQFTRVRGPWLKPSGRLLHAPHDVWRDFLGRAISVDMREEDCARLLQSDPREIKRQLFSDTLTPRLYNDLTDNMSMRIKPLAAQMPQELADPQGLVLKAGDMRRRWEMPLADWSLEIESSTDSIREFESAPAHNTALFGTYATFFGYAPAPLLSR